jgi:hypothetical protein
MGCWYCNDTGQLANARVIENYPFSLRSAGGEALAVPAVIANQHHVQKNMKKIPYSRSNVFRRDDYTCQFCGATPQDRRGAKLTLDHVVPRSIWHGPGTPTSWHNIVTACEPCNTKKANRTPEQAGMPLRKVIVTKDGERKVVFYKKPKPPNYIELSLGISIFDSHLPKEWDMWLEPVREAKRKK